MGTEENQMIVPRHIAHGILTDRVTQTRRPATDRQYRPGQRLPIRLNRGTATCHIIVSHAWIASTGDIDLRDAKDCGFRTTEDFKAAWVQQHDKPWIKRQNELLDEEGLSADDRAETMRARILARFESRHRLRPVWVIVFERDRAEQPRFVAAGWPDYTTDPFRAAPGEMPPVSPSEQEWITDKAGTTTQQWRVLEASHHDRDRELLSQEDRIRAAVNKARLTGVDVSRELWMVRTLQAKGREPRVVAARVEVLERKAFTSRLREAA